MKRKHILLYVQFLIALAFQSFAQTTTQPVQYQLTLDPDGTYKVWMKSITAYTGTNARIGTAQVTLVVPTGTGQNQFTVSNLTGNNSMSWSTSAQTRLNNPSVSGTPTNSDYIVFGFTQPGNVLFDIAANQDILLFSFKNSNNCIGPVALWTTTDPLQVPNNDNFNVGNQITIFGAGFGNKWNSNYGTSPVACNAPPTNPDLVVTITPPASLTQNSPAIFNVNVSNIGTGPSSGATTVTTPIPAGMTYTGSAGTGWTCSQVSTDVVCTNPNFIPASGSSPFTITLTPTQTGTGSISTTVSGGGDSTPSTSIPASYSVGVPLAPNLIVTVTPPATLTQNSPAVFNINVSNVGTAASSGTTTVTTPIPSGMTYTSASGTGWTCSQVANDVVCTNPNSIAVAGNSPYSLTFTPTQTGTGSLSSTVSGGGDSTPSTSTPVNYTVNAPLAPELIVSITPPAILTQNLPAVFNVNVSNIGTAPSTGTTTVTTPIPAGLTYVSSSGTGWTCSQVSSNVVCTNPNSIAVAGSSPYSLTFTPTQTGTSSISSTVSGGGDSTPSTSTPVNYTVNATTPTCLVEYKITTEADGSYKVWMRPNTTFTGTAATIGTAQVTVVFPLPSGGVTPTITNLTSFNSMGWTTNTSQQVSQPNYFYAVFSFSQAASSTVFDLNAGVEIPLFTFKNTGTCYGPLNLWATTDAFQVPNALNFNVGNQISINGAGPGNKWCGNYGSAAACPAVASPNVTVSVTGPTSTTVGTPVTVNVNLTNTGTGPTTSQLTVTTPIPAGTTFTGSTGTGWTCTQVGSNVVCTNPNTLAANGGTSTLGLTFTPTQTGTINITPTLNGGGLTNPVTATPYPITVNPSAVNPILGTTLTAPATGTQNVPYNYSATIANTGTGPTVGTTTFTLALPTGVNYVSATGAGWTCVPQTTFVTCTNPNPIANTSSSSLVISVNPTITGTMSAFGYTTGGGANTSFSTLVNTVISPVNTGQPNVVVTSVSNPATATTNVPFTQSITIGNIGTTPATGPLTYTATLPTGVSFSSVSSGWTCTQTGQSLTCTNPISLSNGASVPLDIQYVATQPLVFTPTGVLSGNGITGGNANIVGTPITITNSGSQPCTAGDCGIGVRYGIKLGSDGKTYTVYMKSANTFTGGAARIGTAQVTLKVPHGTGGNRFLPSNLSSFTATGSMNWTTNTSSRVDAPSIDPNNDYIFFGFSQASSPALFDIVANVEYPLFSFQNLNTCSGTVGLWETTDPFQAGFQSLNPGNQMTILGNGTANAWKCNYTCALPCTLPADLTVSAAQPVPALSVGQTSSINVTVTNLANTANGQITLTVALPAGVSTPSNSFTVNSWSCTTVGQTVTCTNPNTSGLIQNAALSIGIPVIPTSTVAGQILTFNFSVALAGTEVSTNNNTATLVTATAVTAPNLSINIPAFTLYAGQASNVVVNVVNTGTINANGALTTTITLPGGATAPATFVSGAWTCTTVGQVITCTNQNTGGLAPSASLAITVPVTTPANATNGQIVTILANVAAISGENNLVDNSTTGTGQLISEPNLRLVKTATPLALQGTPFDFTFTVSNIGGSNTSGTITVKDTLRNGLKYVSASSSNWTCAKLGVDAQNNDIVHCTTTATHLANGGNFSMFTVRVNPTLAVTASNIAYISGGGVSSTVAKPSAPCNTCTSGITGVFIQPSPDATVTISQPTPVLIAGQASTIVITVNNIGGTAITTALTTSIVLPVGITMPATFTSGSWTCTTSGQTVTCTNPNTGGVPVGGNLTLNLIVTPQTILVGSTPTITVNVLPFSGEANTTNNGGTLTIISPVGAPLVPDLTITLNQPQSNLVVGQNSTMNVVVSNLGLGAATGQLTVTMSIPSGVTASSGISNGWTLTVNGGILTATNPNTTGLASGGTSNFTVNLTPNSTIINTQPTFVGIVSTVLNESNAFNNIAILTTNMSVTTIGVPNLTIYSVLNNNFVASQISTFTVYVVNTGVVSATGTLTTTITLPSGFSAPSSFSSNGWTGTTNGQTVTLTYPNTTGFASANILTIQVPVIPATVLVGSTPAMFVFNIAQVPSEIATVDNVFYFISSNPVLSSSIPNITVNVSTIIPSLTVGQTSNLTINYINTGTIIQTGTLVTNIVLPSGISVPPSFTSNGWTCTLIGQTLNCTNPNTAGLQPNSILNIILPITPNTGTAGTTPGPINIYINGSTIPYIYTFTSPIASAPAPNITVNVGTILAPIAAGQTNYIPIFISNVGSLTATGQLTVNINLPVGISAPASFTQGGWTCTTSGQTMTCTNPNTTGLPSGGTNIFLLPIIPSTTLIGTTPSVNIVVNQVVGEIITINNTFIYVINPAIVGSSSPDLTVQVSQPSPALTAGQSSTITVTVQNIGSATANGQLTASFTLPANFSTSASSFTSGAWTCNVVGQAVTCTNPNTSGLVSGGTSAFTVQLTPSNSAVGSLLSFVVNVNTIVGELNITNNFYTLNVSVPVIVNPNTIPNMNLVLTYNQSLTYYQNTPFTLNYLAYNSSPLASTTGTITVRDTLRYGLKFVSGTGLGWTINKVGVDAQGNDIIVATYNGVLATNASASYTFTVNPTLTGTIYHQAYISGGGMTLTLKGSAPCIGCSISPTGPIIINQQLNFNVAVKAILQGPYVASAGMMHDSLRVKNLIPLSNPYSLLAGFTQVGSGTETTTSTILSVGGTNAIVDWVLIELRSASNPSLIVATKAGLIQRDGDVVSPADGTSPLQFTGIPVGSYYVSIRHRNHLGAMSANPVSLGTTTATVDLTNSAQPAYKLTGITSSNYPQFVSGSKAMLWAGNAAFNNQVIFQGPNNDVDMIFFTIISDPLNTQVISNFIYKGYSQSDVNMDGKTVFQGPDNEVDIIFFNVLMHPENPGFLANYIIWQQIP